MSRTEHAGSFAVSKTKREGHFSSTFAVNEVEKIVSKKSSEKMAAVLAMIELKRSWRR